MKENKPSLEPAGRGAEERLGTAHAPRGLQMAVNRLQAVSLTQRQRVHTPRVCVCMYKLKNPMKCNYRYHICHSHRCL